VPRWARTWLENWGMMGGGGLEAWVLEESEVGLEKPRLTPRGHCTDIVKCNPSGDNRRKYESSGLDINDEKHLAQEDHSCCRRCSVPSSCSTCSVRTHILLIWSRLLAHLLYITFAQRDNPDHHRIRLVEFRIWIWIIIAVTGQDRTVRSRSIREECEKRASCDMILFRRISEDADCSPHRQAREGMSLILSLLRNYEPLPHTSEAETAADLPIRQYGYNYASRRNVKGSKIDNDDEEEESIGDASTLRPGWAKGRRFRYDQPESDSVPIRASRPTPISSFTSRTSSTDYSYLSSSSTQTTTRNESDNSLTTTNSITMTDILRQDHAPAPASFFLSKRNPGLYPGLREKLKLRKKVSYESDS